MLFGRVFHQVGTRTKKALGLAEDSQTSLGPGITSRLLSVERKALPETYQIYVLVVTEVFMFAK